MKIKKCRHGFLTQSGYHMEGGKGITGMKCSIKSKGRLKNKNGNN